MEIAILACGCFWGPEIKFSKLKGVLKTEVGYCGGRTEKTSYEEVCTDKTGHAEAVYLEFDNKIISLDKLLLIFFQTHDPTQLNRQGNDVGTQYRSAIFYTDLKQKKDIENIMKKITKLIIKKKEIVTKIELAKEFFQAEKEHINYYDLNASEPYCQIIINTNIQKLNSLI